jgi:hypothetical protein
MLERKYFFGAAWKAFLDKPLFGHGLETFGLVFTQFRDPEHAFTLEASRTSSVHSVPLAMLSSGGIILGVAYLVFLIFVSWKAVQVLRAGDGQGWSKAVAITWFCFLVQSTVSVEHVALLLANFVVAGLVVAEAAGLSRGVAAEPVKSARDRRRRKQKTQQVNGYVVGGALILLVISLIFSTRLFRASGSFLDGNRALYVNNDLQGGLEAMERAVSLAPWEPVYRFQYAEALAATESVEEAANEAFRSAVDGNYPAAISIQSSVILARAGRFDDAAKIITRSVALDPYARALRLESESILRQIADAATQLGDSDAGRFSRAADQLIVEAEELGIDLSAVAG